MWKLKRDPSGGGVGARFAEVAEVAIYRDQRMLELGGEGDRRLLVLPGVAADTVCFVANVQDLETAVLPVCVVDLRREQKPATIRTVPPTPPNPG